MDTGRATVAVAEPVTAEEADHLFAGLAHADSLLLAVSGGPDSMGLLNLAAQWVQRGRTLGAPRPAIHVAVVDHGLRPEAADEARMVMAAAAAAGLPSATLVWEGVKPATGVQVAAREARYALLFAHARAIDASHVVTAHHADDLAETILMRLCAGSGLTGLGGMAPLRQRGGLLLARPLLCVPKDRLVATCKAAGTPWANDPGNLDGRKGRGRLRQLAGELEALGLGRERLLRLGRRAARADEALEWATDAALGQLEMRRSGATIVFNMRALAAGPEEVFVRVVARVLGQFAQEPEMQEAQRGLVAQASRDGQSSDGENAPLVPDARGYGPVRLERLERACARLIPAARSGGALTTTLAGAVLRLDKMGNCVVAPETRRRGPSAP